MVDTVVDTTAGKRGKLFLKLMPNPKPMPPLLPKLMPMLTLMLGDMDMAVDTDTVDTVDMVDTVTVADITARDPLMLNLNLMPLPITVDTMVLVDTTAVDTDMVVTDMADMDTGDAKGDPLMPMLKPGDTMVDTMAMDTVDTVDMVMDMATMDKCHLSSQILMDQVTR